MPRSAEEDREEPIEPQLPGVGLAVLAEALYLANLLALPGIAFLVLGALYLRRNENRPPLAVAHLAQTFFASLWAGGPARCRERPDPGPGRLPGGAHLGGHYHLLHCLPFDPGGFRRGRTRQGHGGTVLALPAGGPPPAGRVPWSSK